MTVHVLHVAGARPNFMKIAPVMRALGQEPGVRQTLVHTGQHYDARMSKVFFEELGLPKPDVDLGIGSGTHAEQTGRVMIELEKVLRDLRPDLVVVVGDVNSTVAAAMVAAKEQIPVAHVEAGLRSFDWTMPEEINRVVTDRLCQLLLTPSPDGDANLRREGTPEHAIVCVGNVMIDTLLTHLPAARARGTARALGLPAEYALATLHRPANVDVPEVMRELVETLITVAARLPVAFPVHPRTHRRLEDAGLIEPATAAGVRLMEPQGYFDFLSLMAGARLVLTDSGGIQEETTALSVPCITLRDNTERPITVEVGSNVVVGRDRDRILAAVDDVLSGRRREGRVPDLWDGHAGERVASALVRFLRERPDLSALRPAS